MRAKRNVHGSIVIALILGAMLFLFWHKRAYGGEFPPTQGTWEQVLAKKGFETYKLIPTGNAVECRVVSDKKGGIILTAFNKWYFDYGKVLHEVKIDKKGRIGSDWTYVVEGKNDARTSMNEFFPLFSNNCSKFVRDLPKGIKSKMEAYGGRYDVLAPMKLERYVARFSP